MATEQAAALPLYTPPRLRVSAKYVAGATETVDIELGDDATPITGAFVADLVAALVARPAGGGHLPGLPARPLRTEDDVFGGRITWTPVPSTTTTTAAIPVATYTIQNGGSQ